MISDDYNDGYYDSVTVMSMMSNDNDGQYGWWEQSVPIMTSYNDEY